MRADLHIAENPSGTSPTVHVVPPPNRGGRYRVELQAQPHNSACGHHSPQALLWLIFLEAGEEAGREVTDVICSRCEPGRFARVEAWAEALR